MAVNNTAITTLAPYHTLSGGTYEILPDLPDGLVMDANTGELSGTPIETSTNITYTVWVNNTNGEKLNYTFTIEILEDSDGDEFAQRTARRLRFEQPRFTRARRGP